MAFAHDDLGSFEEEEHNQDVAHLSHLSREEYIGSSESEENLPLIPVEEHGSWYSRLGKGLYNRVVKPIGKGLYHFVRHPIAGILAVATSAPNAVNAILGTTNTPPENASFSWWYGLTGGEKTHAIFNGFASFLLNIIMNINFLSSTWIGLKEAYATCCRSIKSFAGNLGLIFISMIASITVGAIGYNAFLWLPAGTVTASIPAALSFVITFATGYVTLRNFVKKIKHARDEDVRFQNDLKDRLQRIKVEYLQDVNEFLRDQHTKEKLTQYYQTTDENEKSTLALELQDTLTKLFEQKLTELSNTCAQIIRDKSSTEVAKEYAGFVFDLVVAAMMIAPTFMTLTENAFFGISFLSGRKLDHLAKGAKIAIAALPGLLSALYYGLMGYDFRRTMVEFVQQLYHHPSELPGALAFLTLNGLSSSGFQDLSATIIAHDNIFSIPDITTSTGRAFVAFNALSGGLANTTMTVRSVYLNQMEEPIPVSSETEALIHFLNDVSLPHATIQQIRGSDFFRRQGSDSLDGNQDQSAEREERAGYQKI